MNIPFTVIGTSKIVEEFYAASQGTNLVLRGVCSRDAQRGRAFAEKIGQPKAAVFTSVEDLARAPGIAAVYVASPNSCHAAQCETLLLGGKHVICEKPITAQPHELEHLQTLARRQGLIYMEAIMYLHTPARQAVREALASLGNITSAHFDLSQLSSRYDALRAGELPNIFNPALAAGGWNDLGIYCAYPAIDFFGPPQHISATMHMLHTGADGAGIATLQYPDKIVTLTWSKLGQSRGVSQIMGDEGTLTIRSLLHFQGITLYDRQGRGRELTQPLQKFEVMRYEAQSFCDYILGRPPRIPYEQATDLSLQVSKFMQQVRQTHPKTTDTTPTRPLIFT